MKTTILKSIMITIVILSYLTLVAVALPIDTVSSNKTNPELDAGGFQGDILLPPTRSFTRGVGFNSKISRWPNQVIPYDLSLITNANDRRMITTAMDHLMYDVGTPIPNQVSRYMCVYFRPAQPTDSEVLKIQYGNGCSATVGYGVGYQKTLSLQPQECFVNGIIQHELTHVLGFFHEQSRPDRDSYITIHKENIHPNQMHNFEKYEWNAVAEAQGTDYDYGSLMHYPSDAFSMNGRHTISTRQSNVNIGQRVKLSPTDIQEIRHYYKC